jgi:ribosome biogenesis GTPase
LTPCWLEQPSRPAPGTAALAGTKSGLVVAGFGRHVMVETESGERVICHHAARRTGGCGRPHSLAAVSQDEGTIIDERNSLFYRQDEMRTKSFAASLDQVLINRGRAEFSESQLTRFDCSRSRKHIKPVLP